MFHFSTIFHNLRELALHPPLCTTGLKNASIALIGSCLMAPFQLREFLQYRQILKQVSVEKPPIFLIGYWGAGQSELHQNLLQDPQFGYVSLLQALSPQYHLGASNLHMKLISLFKDTLCLQDREAPLSTIACDDEVALAQRSPYSLFRYWAFPKLGDDLFRKYVLFEGAYQKYQTTWKKAYAKLLEHATWATGVKRLLLNNPANTARISLLREMFPEARFIYLYRNPYTNIAALRWEQNQFLSRNHWQEFSLSMLDQNLCKWYQALDQCYQEEKTTIPSTHLLEIAYEEWVESPIQVLRRIYETFELTGFDKAFKGFKPNAVASAETNITDLPKHIVQQLEGDAQSAIERWNYQNPYQ